MEVLCSDHAVSKESAVHQLHSAHGGRNLFEMDVDISLEQNKGERGLEMGEEGQKGEDKKKKKKKNFLKNRFR